MAGLVRVHPGINENTCMYYVGNKTDVDTFLVCGVFASLIKTLF